MQWAHLAKGGGQPGAVLARDTMFAGPLFSRQFSDDDAFRSRHLDNLPPEAPLPNGTFFVAILSGFSGALVGFFLAGHVSLLAVGFVALVLGGVSGWTAARIHS